VISTVASFPKRKGAFWIVAIYLLKNAVCKGNYLPAFTLITKTSVVEVWSRFVTGVESLAIARLGPPSRDARISRLRFLSQLRGPYVWVLRFPLNLPATEGAAVTYERSSDFPGDSLLHTGTHLHCAGGVLISVTVEDQ